MFVLATTWVRAAEKPSAASPGVTAQQEAELGRRWRNIRDPQPTLASRDIFGFALEAASVGWHPEYLERALAVVRQMQDLDPNSKTFGNFHWSWGQTGVFDQNAVEFCLQQGVLLRLRYFDRLPPRAQRQLDELLTTGIEGMTRHRVPTGYTNIFLMKTWNFIAVGEALGRASLAADGYRMLEEWIRFTAQNGITEYVSPNYYGVDLESLGLIAKQAQRPAGRAQAETALRFFWADMAANWYAPAQRLGGANSRCYQYLEGRGHLDDYLLAEGWQTDGKPPGLKTFLEACRWTPPATLTEPLRTAVPRTVVQRWGTEPWQRATHYVAHDFSLGSAGASDGSDDRALVLNLGRSPKIPEIVLFMDGRGDPYGSAKTLDRSQHAKALHLTPFIASVQRGPEVLRVMADDLAKPAPRRPGDAFTCLYTQLPIPAPAEVWFGDQPAPAGTPTEPTIVPPGAPVFVRLEGVVVGVRFLYTMDAAGAPAPVVYVQDQPRLPAKRLTVVLASGTARGRGGTALWLLVADGLAADCFAAFRQTFSAAKATAGQQGDVLTVEAEGQHGALRIVADLKKGERRRLEGGESGTDTALLRVNGRDVGRELLAEFGAH